MDEYLVRETVLNVVSEKILWVSCRVQSVPPTNSMTLFYGVVQYCTLYLYYRWETSVTMLMRGRIHAVYYWSRYQIKYSGYVEDFEKRPWRSISLSLGYCDKVYYHIITSGCSSQTRAKRIFVTAAVHLKWKWNHSPVKLNLPQINSSFYPENNLTCLSSLPQDFSTFLLIFIFFSSFSYLLT